MSICEGGVQRLTNTEMVEALRQEVDMLRNPVYCPECEACGENGCCSGAMCKKNANNKCLYGDSYALDYQYNKEVADKLFDVLNVYDSVLAGQIMGETYNKIYNSTLDTSKSVS